MAEADMLAFLSVPRLVSHRILTVLRLRENRRHEGTARTSTVGTGWF